MKKILILLTFLAISCSASEKYVKITVKNSSVFDRMTELVEIPVDRLKGRVTPIRDQVYLVKDDAGNVIPSQVTHDRKIIFQPELKAGESKAFIVTAGEPREFVARTYGRFITERKDDFAWENDRVAFRIYGPALIATDGPSNGIDCWYKRTNDLIIDKWYGDDLSGRASYHVDHGEGLDDYKVGRTLGAGAMAPYVDDRLWLNENFVSQELLDNGPLRTTFRLTYNEFDVYGTPVGESRIISIDAGSQLSKVVQLYDIGIEEPMHVAAGIVKRGEGDSVVRARDYVIYAEPSSETAGNVYIAVVIPTGIDETTTNTYENTNAVSGKKEVHSHVLAITTRQPDESVTYYTGYGWSKFGFPTLADFQSYVERFTEALWEPLIVKY